MSATAAHEIDAETLSADARAVARDLRRPSLTPAAVSTIACLLDAVALGLGLWFAAFATPIYAFDPVHAALLFTVGASSVVLGLAFGGAYRLHALRKFLPGTLAILGLGALIAAVGGAAVGPMFSLIAFVVPARALGSALAGAALDFGLTERRAVIVGGGERGARVMAALADSPGNDVRVCGIFDDRDDERSPRLVNGVPKLGTVESLVAFTRAAEIDTLIITLPLNAERRIREILQAVEVLPLDVRLSDFSNDPAFRRRNGRPAEGGLIDAISRPLRHGELVLKRCLDVLGAIVAIALLAPLLALTALAVRLDSPGPVLFRQPRHGYNHRPVEIWKFRSMQASECDPAARRVVTRGDRRITRVGRFIRRWSIDELPQLFNVLAGDLSLVGPRPHALAAVSSRQQSFEAIVEGYAARHKVRPGVTGLAQINGWRGEIDDPESLRKRVEFDLHYIENWSIWLDLYILAITPFRLLDTRRAY